MKNLYFIQETDRGSLIPQLQQLAPNGAHFTNGTYAYPKDLIVPTTLAGFKRVTKNFGTLPLVIAVNSDSSMEKLNKKEHALQPFRAFKVAVPIARLFPNNKVIIIFYDEETPEALYKALKKCNLTRTLHKWGYGTSEGAPKIEGAEYFDLTYGFPLPNDIKPLCYDETKRSEKPQKIIIDDLRDTYINKENQLLFNLPTSLKQYESKKIYNSEKTFMPTLK